MQHPFSNLNSAKSRLSEAFFQKCGKQEIIKNKKEAAHSWIGL
jgi:hypothetical protein